MRAAAPALGVAVAATIALLAWSQRSADPDLTRRYRIGFQRPAPRHFPGPDGEPRRSTLDLLNEVANRTGIKLEWDPGTLEEVRPSREDQVLRGSGRVIPGHLQW